MLGIINIVAFSQKNMEDRRLRNINGLPMTNEYVFQPNENM